LSSVIVLRTFILTTLGNVVLVFAEVSIIIKFHW